MEISKRQGLPNSTGEEPTNGGENERILRPSTTRVLKDTAKTKIGEGSFCNLLDSTQVLPQGHGTKQTLELGCYDHLSLIPFKLSKLTKPPVYRPLKIHQILGFYNTQSVAIIFLCNLGSIS